MKLPVRNCDECKYFDDGEVDDSGNNFIRKPSCTKGFRPRFFVPRSPVDINFGFKSRCPAFEKPDFISILFPS